MAERELVVVFRGNTFEANLVKGLLEDAGIVAFLNNEVMGNLAPWYVAPGGAGAVSVIISDQDSDEARPIIDKFINDMTDSL